MNFSNTCAYCLYKIYNQLAIHNAPLFVLDLFLPILTTETWKEALQNEIKNAKVFKTVDEFLSDLHESRKLTGKILTSEKITFSFNDGNDNTFYNLSLDGNNTNILSWVTCNLNCTSNNGFWFYGNTDSES